MPITSANFDVANATPADLARLDKALAYLQQSPTATAMLEMAVQGGVKIGINAWGTDHYGPDVTPGSDQFDYDGSGRVLWNPDSAMEVRSPDRAIIGVQSAALALVHEVFHALDPGLVDGFMSRLPGYGNITEYSAIMFENQAALELGEIPRENHWGISILSLDPTTHTMPDEDGGLVWAQLASNGATEFGGLYAYQPDGDPSDQVPVFGSADPGGHYHDGDDSGNRNDGGSGATVIVYGAEGKPIDTHSGSGSGAGSGGDWVEWNGEIDAGGGKNPNDTLQDKSSDDPDYQGMAATWMMADAPAVTGGAHWQGPATLVGVPHFGGMLI